MKTYCVPNIIPASTVMNATINSAPQQLKDAIGFSIQVVFTGTPTGSFKLQASDDPVSAAVANGNLTGTIAAPVNWSDIADSSNSVTAAGNIIWNFTWPMFNWVRVVYSDTSSGLSTAIVTVSTFNGKGF